MDQQQIDFSKLPDQTQIDLSKLPDKPQGQEPPKEEPSLLGKLWDWGNKPLSTIPGEIYKIAAPIITDDPITEKYLPGIHQAINSFSHDEGANLANSLTSPINLGMAALSGGESLLGEVAPAIAKGFGIANKAMSVPFFAEGAKSAYEGHPITGGLEMLGAVPGLTGLTSDALKAIKPIDYEPRIKPSEVLPDWLSSNKQTELAKAELPKPEVQPEIDFSKLPDQPEPTTLLEAQQLGEQSVHSPEAISEHVDKIPAIASGDIPKPSPDIINSEPVAAAVPSDIVMPRAGQVRPTPDINGLTANLGSADQILANNPVTSGIPEKIIPAYDNMQMWVKDQLTKVGNFTQGLNKNSRLIVRDLLEGNDVPASVQELQAYQGIRGVLDDIHSQYPDVISAQQKAQEAGETFDPKSVGYLSDYLTRIQKQNPGVFATLRRYYFGEKIPTELPGTMGDLHDVGIGEPSSPFIKKRTGEITNPEDEINRILPLYIQAAGREIFLKPAVKAATDIYQSIPDNSVAKELSKFYINNVANYNSEQALHRAYNTFAGRMANVTARSWLDWNIGLHSLHAAELATSVFPELGPQYTSQGLAKLLTSPKDSLAELGRTGLIQGEYTPPAFKTLGDRYQSMANFFNMAEKLSKGVAYFGAKQKYIDQGLNENQAILKAIGDAKQYTYTTDPARQAKGLTAKSNVAGGELASKLGGQFKSVPLKIIEQYANIISNIKNDPQKAARLIQGNAIAIALAQTGMKTFHVNPLHMLDMTTFGAFGNAASQIGKDLGKLDLASALLHTIEWATPGGQQLIAPIVK